MKKYLFILLGLTFNTIQSQEVVSGLRYAQDNTTGTARFRAMSGAFGALGGDLSSINVNPAGSAVFLNNQLGFSFSNFDIKNNSEYYGSQLTGKKNALDLNQAGGVFVFKNYDPKANWKKFSLAINYENTNNFNNTTRTFGTNPTNSVANYFLSYANANPAKNQAGIPLGTLKQYNYFDFNYVDQQAYLGYRGYLINPISDTDDNVEYISNAPVGTSPNNSNYYQENTIISEGYNGKLSFNAATSYKDILYLGLSLNSHFTDFRQNTLFYEDNGNASNFDDLKAVSFENNLYTFGSGFSFQLGAIAKINNELRLGISYESPTWNKLNDELRQNLITTTYITATTSNTNDPNSDGTVVYNDYKLKTPGKTTGSMALVFNKKGLISFDYSYKDYSKINYSIEDDSRNRFINSDIANELTAVSEIRIGGEYKIERLSLRGGYRFEGSPYKNKSTMGDLTGYSAGLGYNFGGTKADLSYAYAKRNSNQGFFSQGFTDGANINSINNTVTFTLLFEL
ncbi:OmpP1/FadL family transporter [Flavobacterium nitratireducens]|uniref:OmpP1/FadL family transporter n=1 Tax=Flavobacterium nitratireducens TaxID=992289 RepID=UPI0024153738|nr:transporter [Flavobacterium nitratireducens]